MEEYLGMSGRTIVMVIIASYLLGWLGNTACFFPGDDIALGIRLIASAACFVFFLLMVDLKELFSSHDFHEILAIFFFPFIIANALPWTISTIMIPAVILFGIVLLICVNKLKCDEREH